VHLRGQLIQSKAVMPANCKVERYHFCDWTKVYSIRLPVRSEFRFGFYPITGSRHEFELSSIARSPVRCIRVSSDGVRKRFRASVFKPHFHYFDLLRICWTTSRTTSRIIFWRLSIIRYGFVAGVRFSDMARNV